MLAEFCKKVGGIKLKTYDFLNKSRFNEFCKAGYGDFYNITMFDYAIFA
jgi:hypothetical protein